MLWMLNGWPYSAPIIADGRIVYANNQDGQIYCFGMGLSKTTVSAPQTPITLGQSMMITGTVTDNTPSGKDQGTPAISYANMDSWMGYLYQQQPFPTDATGVPVKLDAIDPNGNLVHLGDVTSDNTGSYGFMWTPEIPGTFQIIATFGGSGSYSRSFAQTYAGVTDTPSATIAPTPAPASMVETYFVPSIAGLFVLIIIVLAIVLLQMFRKRA
jgi:hypothetical protein